jgi:AcrR family transcriptional regulator
MKINKKITIIKAAQELFARFGFVKTTVDEIARAARMGKATLYHYFKSKEDVFKEVIEKESRILNKKVKEAIDKEETPQKKLRAFVLTRMMYLNELANIYSVLKDEFLNHYAFIEKAREKDFYQEIKSIKNILNEGIEKNIFVINDAELTSFAIISALKGLEYPWSIKISLPDIEKNVDKLLEILFRGILIR